MPNRSRFNISIAGGFAWAFYLFVLSATFSVFLCQLFAALVIITGIWLYLTPSSDRNISLWIWLFPALFLILVMVSVIAAGRFAESIPQLKKTWVLLCLFPALFFSHLLSKPRITEFLVWGTLLASLLGLGRYALGGIERAAPFSGGYTTMALFEAAALPLILGQILRMPGRKRWLYGAAGAIIVAGLIFSGTRAGWLAALVGLVLTGFGMGKRMTLYAFLAAIAVIAAIPGTRHAVVHRLVNNPRGDYTSGRSLLWESALGILPDLPLWGYGPGSFHRLMPETRLRQIGDPKISSWHSTPLEILIESGPPALLVFLAAAAIFLMRAWRQYARDGRDDPVRMAVFASLMSFYLAGLTTNIMRDFLLSALLIILWVVSQLDDERIIPKGEVLVGNQ